MEPALRPRRNDHLVEPLYEGLRSHDSAPQRARRVVGLALGLGLPALAAALWWLV